MNGTMIVVYYPARVKWLFIHYLLKTTKVNFLPCVFFIFIILEEQMMTGCFIM